MTLRFLQYIPEKKKSVVRFSLTALRIVSLVPDALFFLISFGNKEETLKYHRQKNPLHKLFLSKIEEVSFASYFEKNIIPASLKGNVLDFKGIYLPSEILNDSSFYYALSWAFEDSYFIHQYYNDDYSAEIVDKVDKFVPEGSYFYKNSKLGIDMMVYSGDVVIDAGAWIGDFSAVAAYYGAMVYAFEPTPGTYELLKQTAKLNSNIIPVCSGLGASTESVNMVEIPGTNGSNFISEEGNTVIQLMKLDDFVAENNIEKVDFIKADIEGFERELLKGATWVLQNHEPKLSLCTYHNKEDPQLLKNLILAANPKYKIMQRKKKLFAWV